MKNVSTEEKQATWAQVSSMLGNTPESMQSSMTANIIKTFKASNKAERETGLNWYSDTRAFCNMLAARYGVTPAVAVAVISALSPLNQWSRNKIDAENVLRAYTENEKRAGTRAYLDIEELAATVKACTFGRNKMRAFQIIDEQDPSIVQTSRKTRAFHDNILNADSTEVTIDFHAFSIAVGYQYTASSQPSVANTLYADVQQAYRNATKHLNRNRKSKLTAYQLQAITWLAWRRLVGVHENAGTV
jgi:hypothetical protein